MDLIAVTSAGPEFIRELTSEEYDVFRDATRRLATWERYFHSFAMVEHNHREFDAELAKGLAVYARGGMDHLFLSRVAFSAGRRLLNYLASVRFFLDFSEAWLSGRFGRESVQLSAFRTACSAAYDAHFAYRFLYRLRNYAQHAGLPVAHVQIAGHKEVNAGRPELSVALDPQDLGRSYDGWSVVKAELIAMEDHLYIPPLLQTMTEDLRSINTVVTQMELPSGRTAGETIMAIIAEAAGPGRTPALGVMQRIGDDDYRIEIEWPPLRMLQHLGFIKTANPDSGISSA